MGLSERKRVGDNSFCTEGQLQLNLAVLRHSPARAKRHRKPALVRWRRPVFRPAAAAMREPRLATRQRSPSPANSRRNHARALTQSRRTVRSVMPRASAVSSSL